MSSFTVENGSGVYQYALNKGSVVENALHEQDIKGINLHPLIANTILTNTFEITLG